MFYDITRVTTRRIGILPEYSWSTLLCEVVWTSSQVFEIQWWEESLCWHHHTLQTAVEMLSRRIQWHSQFRRMEESLHQYCRFFPGPGAWCHYMSCVRASNHGIGFVADICRMNVVLTRARRAIWVPLLSHSSILSACVQNLQCILSCTKFEPLLHPVIFLSDVVRFWFCCGLWAIQMLLCSQKIGMHWLQMQSRGTVSWKWRIYLESCWSWRGLHTLQEMLPQIAQGVWDLTETMWSVSRLQRPTPGHIQDDMKPINLLPWSDIGDELKKPLKILWRVGGESCGEPKDACNMALTWGSTSGVWEERCRSTLVISARFLCSLVL